MAFLTRDEILTVNDRKTESVSVPEWGGEVLVSVMSGQQRDAYESLITEVDASGKARHKLDNLRAKLVSCALVDENGETMFSASDINALGRKSAAALQRVYAVATRLNRVTEDEVEEAAKNS
jgi:hypothetical protein